MRSDQYNLLIVIDQTLLDPQDFLEIARHIQAKSRQISVYVLSGHFPVEQVKEINWRLPTFSVGINGEGHCVPKRGPYFFNRPIDKLVQLETMRKAGVQIPRSEAYNRDETYSVSEWGDYVVIKSSQTEGSSGGKTAHLTPTLFLSEPNKFDDPVRTLLIEGNAIVQEFIPTGSQPTGHRVSTLLGRALYHFSAVSTMTLPQLDPMSPQTYLYDSNMVDQARDIVRERSLVSDPAAIIMAQKIAKAFPTIPLLGIDLVKSERNGEYYALEVNAGGNTWHFSSPLAVDGRKQISREQRINQFGAWDIAAQVLIEKTLYYAK